MDKDQLLKDALKVEKINDFNTNEKGSYDTILANGDKITVYQRENADMRQGLVEHLISVLLCRINQRLLQLHQLYPEIGGIHF